MAEILSRSEVELLLSALTPTVGGEELDRSSPAKSPVSVATGDVGAPESALARTAVSFAEVLRLAFEQTLADALGRTGQLRRQMPRRESLRQYLEPGHGDPVWFILEGERSSSDLLISLERGFGTMLLQMLLGGEPRLGGEEGQRGWSELDVRLFERLIRESAARLPGDLGWTLANVEFAMALSSFATWNEQSACWVETWDCRFGPLRGAMRLATPWELISRRASAVAGLARDAAPGGPGASPGEFVAVLAELRLPASRLRELKVGDLVVTDQPVDTPVVGQHAEGSTWRVQAGQTDGRRAVRLVERIGNSTMPEQGDSLPPETAPADGA